MTTSICLNQSKFFIAFVKKIDKNLILNYGMPKRLIRLKVHHDGFKPVNSLEWGSMVAYVR